MEKIINEINKNLPHKNIYLYHNFNIPIIDLLVNKSKFLKYKKEAIRQLNSINLNCIYIIIFKKIYGL